MPLLWKTRTDLLPRGSSTFDLYTELCIMCCVSSMLPITLRPQLLRNLKAWPCLKVPQQIRGLL